MNPDSNQAGHLVWLLEGLAAEVPFVRGSVLLSSDGLPKAAHGLDQENAEKFAALAAGFFGTARTAGMLFNNTSEVRQVVVELASSQLFLSWAGYNSVLAVLAESEVDALLVSHGMLRLIKAVGPHLATDARTPHTAPGAGGP